MTDHAAARRQNGRQWWTPQLATRLRLTPQSRRGPKTVHRAGLHPATSAVDADNE
jgi:hypothetical protein